MAQELELQAALARVESHLAALGEALRGQAAEAVAGEAAELQRALEPLRRAVRAGALPPQLRERLALAAGRTAAQRESLARGGAALHRAIDVLLPGAAPRIAYSAAGLGERRGRGASVQA